MAADVTVALGIDPSLAGCGLAVWRSTTNRLSLHTIGTDARWSGPQRRAHIRRGIVRHIDGEPPGSVVAALEGAIHGSKAGLNTALSLARLGATIEDALWSRSVPFAVITPPGHIKKFATGSFTASKDQMKQAAADQLSGWAVPADDNQSDALWILAMTMHQYRRPLCGVPTVRACVLDKILWPPFTI